MIDELIEAMEKMVETGKKLPQSEREAFKSKFMMIFAPKESSLDKVGPALYGTDSDKLDGQHGDYYRNVGNLNTGTLHTDRFSAWADLVAESKLGTGAAQIAYGNHSHGGTLSGNLYASFDGALAVVGNAAIFVAPYAGTISKVYAAVKTKGTANSTIVDVHKNGTTIFTTQANRPTIAYDDADGVASGTPDVTSFVAGDVFTFDIDAAATGAAGLSIVAALTYEYTQQPDPAQVFFTMEGDLAVTAGKLRIYNLTGVSRTIQKVQLSVSNAPAGAAVIVDINKGGTTIFTTQANRPQIAAGAFTGISANVDVTSWADGEYLTFDIDQIGSTSPGANLTVCVVYV